MVKNFILVALGGALGSALRYGAGLLIGQKPFPWSILFINTLGSFIIGTVMALGLKNQLFAGNWRLFLATGVCGGFTTFSAFSLDNFLLLQNGKTGLLAANIIGSVVLGIVAVWMGFKLISVTTN